MEREVSIKRLSQELDLKTDYSGPQAGCLPFLRSSLIGQDKGYNFRGREKNG